MVYLADDNLTGICFSCISIHWSLSRRVLGTGFDTYIDIHNQCIINTFDTVRSKYNTTWLRKSEIALMSEQQIRRTYLRESLKVIRYLHDTETYSYNTLTKNCISYICLHSK